MRIRQIKPQFWTDAKLIKIPLDVRLFYVGLWCVADDAGWFEWDPAQISVDLQLKESLVRKGMDALIAADRVIVHECGHGEVPHLVEHQRLASPERRVVSTYKQHLSNCFQASPPLSTQPRDLPEGTVRNGKVRNGKEQETAGASLVDILKVDPETGTYIYVAPETKV